MTASLELPERRDRWCVAGTLDGHTTFIGFTEDGDAVITRDPGRAYHFQDRRLAEKYAAHWRDRSIGRMRECHVLWAAAL